MYIIVTFLSVHLPHESIWTLRVSFTWFPTFSEFNQSTSPANRLTFSYWWEGITC